MHYDVLRRNRDVAHAYSSNKYCKNARGCALCTTDLLSFSCHNRHDFETVACQYCTLKQASYSDCEENSDGGTLRLHVISVISSRRSRIIVFYLHFCLHLS